MCATNVAELVTDGLARIFSRPARPFHFVDGCTKRSCRFVRRRGVNRSTAVRHPTRVHRPGDLYPFVSRGHARTVVPIRVISETIICRCLPQTLANATLPIYNVTWSAYFVRRRIFQRPFRRAPVTILFARLFTVVRVISVNGPHAVFGNVTLDVYVTGRWTGHDEISANSFDTRRPSSLKYSARTVDRLTLFNI